MLKILPITQLLYTVKRMMALYHYTVAINLFIWVAYNLGDIPCAFRMSITSRHAASLTRTLVRDKLAILLASYWCQYIFPWAHFSNVSCQLHLDLRPHSPCHMYGLSVSDCVNLSVSESVSLVWWYRLALFYQMFIITVKYFNIVLLSWHCRPMWVGETMINLTFLP